MFYKLFTISKKKDLENLIGAAFHQRKSNLSELTLQVLVPEYLDPPGSIFVSFSLLKLHE